jgi:transposase
MSDFRVVEGDEGPSLALGGMQVIQARESEDVYLLDVESVAPIDYCQKCGVIGQLISFGRLSQEIRDTPIHGKTVRLLVKRRRFRCKACGATSTEPLEWLHEERRATKRLVEAIERDSLAMPNLHVAHKYGVDDKTVKNVLNSFIDREEIAFERVTPRWLGIDELHIMKKPRGMFADIERFRMIEMLPDRNKPTVLAFLRTLDPAVVEVVTMDMWRPYRDAVREVFPQAVVVVDKFHVVRLANYAMEEVRKKQKAGLDVKERRKLKADRFTLLRRMHELTVFQVGEINTWRVQFPELIQAYYLKEKFFRIYDAKSEKVAREKYATWKATIPKGLYSYFAEVIRSVENWQTEVFAYFENHRLTNAYTESLNRSVRDVDRAGRGYSFEALRAKLLYGQDARKRPRLASISKRVKTELMPKAPLAWNESNFAHIIPLGGFKDVDYSNMVVMSAEEHKLFWTREQQQQIPSTASTDQGRASTNP